MPSNLLWIFPWLLLSSAQAHDGGIDILFKGEGPFRSIVVDSLAKRGDVLWDFGPSDPAREDFSAIIFQGLAGDSGIVFEAALKSGRGWGPWVKATIEFFPNGRFWGTLPLPGKARTIFRLRLLHQGIAAGKTVELYGVETAAMKATASAPDQSPPADTPPTPGAPPSQPALIDREGWSANPPTEPYAPLAPMRITAHHTEAAQPFSLPDAIQEMQVIQRFHQRGRGWIDIGYHFLIDGSGRIFQGRPETVIGAHVRGQNEGNIGIALMGGFHPPRSQQPTAEQIESLILLGRWLVGAFAIDPATFKGHRDYQATACPGDIFYPRLGDIQREISPPPSLAVAGRLPVLRLEPLPPLTVAEKEFFLRVLFENADSR